MSVRAGRYGKLLLKALRLDANTIADVPFTIQAVSGQTGDLYQILDSAGAVLAKVNAAGQLIQTAAASLADPFGLGGQLRMARARYNFAVDGGVVGLITPAVNAVIPNNAIIIGGILNPTTALVGASSTIAVGTSAGSAANSLKAATAEATYSIDAVLATVPVFTAASSIKLTAAGSITITVAVADLTAGVMEITVFYFVAAA